LGVAERVLVFDEAPLPIGSERRVAGVAERVEHHRVVVDHDPDLAVAGQCRDQPAFDLGGGSPIALRPHDQAVLAQTMRLEPIGRRFAEVLGPTGDEHDLMVVAEPGDHGEALRMGGIGAGGGEEPIPVLRSAVEEVQTVADVGDHTVEIDDRDRSPLAHLVTIRRACGEPQARARLWALRCGRRHPVPEPDEGVLDIDVHDDVVVLRGDLDMDTVEVFSSQLEVIDGSIVLDLEGVTFLDSTGLQSLLRAREAAGKRGAELILRHPSTAVQRVLDLTNMWETLAIEREVS
jgi:stage II sporulation protein AA (anti-sigma F factor antagonist)